MPVPVEPPVEPTAAAVAAAVEAERARVVAWLRAEAFLALYEATPDAVADAIERGAHRDRREEVSA